MPKMPKVPKMKLPAASCRVSWRRRMKWGSKLFGVDREIESLDLARDHEVIERLLCPVAKGLPIISSFFGCLFFFYFRHFSAI
jgi:hypothetical protein